MPPTSKTTCMQKYLTIVQNIIHFPQVLSNTLFMWLPEVATGTLHIKWKTSQMGEYESTHCTHSDDLSCNSKVTYPSVEFWKKERTRPTQSGTPQSTQGCQGPHRGHHHPSSHLALGDQQHVQPLTVTVWIPSTLQHWGSTCYPHSKKLKTTFRRSKSCWQSSLTY